MHKINGNHPTKKKKGTKKKHRLNWNSRFTMQQIHFINNYLNSWNKCSYQRTQIGSSNSGSAEMHLTSMRTQVQSLALSSG